MPTLTEPQAILRFRKEINDNIDLGSIDPPPSHFAIDEPMVGILNGMNTEFRIRHALVLPLSAPVVTVKDTTGVPSVVTVVDVSNGLVSLLDPPASSVFATYHYAFFTDAQLQVFLQSGYEFVSASTITGIAEAQYPAMFAFARAQAYEMISANSGDFFDFSVGGESASKGEVTARWLAKAKEARELAHQLRAGSYSTNDRRLRPAQGFGRTVQPVGTPPR